MEFYISCSVKKCTNHQTKDHFSTKSTPPIWWNLIWAVELHALTKSPKSNVHFQWPTKKHKYHFPSRTSTKAQGVKQPCQHNFYQIDFLVIWICALFMTFQDAYERQSTTCTPSSLTPPSPQIARILAAWSKSPSLPSWPQRYSHMRCAMQRIVNFRFYLPSVHYALLSLA